MSDTEKTAVQKSPDPRQQLITVLGHTLWRMNLDPEEAEMTDETRRADWTEHRATYLQAARRLVKEIEKKGLRVVKATD